MTDAQKWTGQIVDGDLSLLEYVGGSRDSAVFRTEILGTTPQRAALKLVPADPVSAEAHLSRWNAAAKLSHPHLLRVLRSGRCTLDDNEMLFVVTEFAEENLSQILPTRALTPRESSEMLDPLLEALIYLHAQGFVHGDLKPSNVMASGDQLKLSSDAVCPIGESTLSPLPPAYAAPETINEGVSPAADAWALGATLTEVLTQSPPSSPGVSSANLPSPFLEIIEGCFRHDPSQRITVPEVVALLHTPQVASPVSTPVIEQQAAPVGRAGLRVGVIAAIAGLAVLLVVAGLWRRSSEPVSSAPTTTVSQPQTNAAPTAVQPPVPEQQPQVAAETRSVQHEEAPAPAPAPVTPAARVNQPASGEHTGENTASTTGVVRQVLPSIPQKARNTIEGKVRVKVKVQVAPSGDVTDAEFLSAGPSRYFANLVMAAAKEWKFDPSSSARSWNLQFEIHRDDTRVISAPSR